MEMGRVLPRREVSFWEPVPRLRDRFEGACSIVGTFSCFGFRSTVARRRGDNSCTKVQNWSRAITSDESARNMRQLRQTGVVQVF